MHPKSSGPYRLPPFTVAMLLVTFAGLCLADQFRMKDGSVHEGEIVSQTETNLTLRVRLPDNIFTERDLLKSQIAEIIKDPEDLVAFRKLPAVPLNRPFNHPLQQYDSAISNFHLPFLSQFPNSTHATEVKRRLEEITRERDMVASGSVRFEGKWYSAAQAKRRAFDFRAYPFFTEIARARAARNFPLVLKHWQSFEGQYFGSTYTAKTLNETVVALDEYNRLLPQQLQETRDAISQYHKKIYAAQNAVDTIRPHMTIVKDRMQR